jgi:hypothetical protein
VNFLTWVTRGYLEWFGLFSLEITFIHEGGRAFRISTAPSTERIFSGSRADIWALTCATAVNVLGFLLSKSSRYSRSFWMKNPVEKSFARAHSFNACQMAPSL